MLTLYNFVRRKEIERENNNVCLISSDLMSQEVVFKKLLQALLLGDNSKMNEACLHSLEWTWPFFTSVSAVNTNTVHPELLYRGVIECIAKFK